MVFTPSQFPVQATESQNQPQSAPSLMSRLWPACKWALAAFIFTASWFFALLLAIAGLFAGPAITRAQRWRPGAESPSVVPAPAWAERLRALWTRRRGLAALLIGALWIIVAVCYRSPYAWIGGAVFGAGLAARSGAWRNFGSAIVVPASLPFSPLVTFTRRWRALIVVAAAAVAALQLSNTFYSASTTMYTQSYSVIGGPTLSVDHNGKWVHGYQTTTRTYSTPYSISGTDANSGWFFLGLLSLAVTFHIRRNPPAVEPIQSSAS